MDMGTRRTTPTLSYPSPEKLVLSRLLLTWLYTPKGAMMCLGIQLRDNASDWKYWHSAIVHTQLHK